MQNRIERVDAQFSYRTQNRMAIRFAPNRTPIRTLIRIRVDGPLKGGTLPTGNVQA
jgi:hypothetical protein